MISHLHRPSFKIVLRHSKVQRGVVLPIALLMLVILMVGAAALMKTVDTAVQVSGNMAFKQSATLTADRGILAATQWIDAATTTTTVLYNDNVAGGYCSKLHKLERDQEGDSTLAGWDATLPADSTQNGWDTGCQNVAAVVPVALAADASGNQVDYMIHRLCLWGDGASPTPGAVAGVPGAVQACTTAAGKAEGNATLSSHRSGRDLIGTSVPTVAYRITVRVRADCSGTPSRCRTQSFVQSTVMKSDPPV